MKKVLHIVEPLCGGVLTYLEGLANGLCDQYETYIVYNVRPQTPSNVESLFDSRIHMLFCEELTREIRPRQDYKAFQKIREIAKEVQPDIVHLHSSKAGVLGRFALNGKKTALFYTPHGYSFLMQDRGKAKLWCYEAIERIAGKRRCLTIATSKSEYAHSLRVTKRSTCINNGIHLPEMRRLTEGVAKNSQTAGHPSVFTIGRACPQKNPALFNQIALAFPDIDFLWIGDGELRALLTAPNIRVTGWLPREKAIEQAMAADVFLLPSLWEGLPLSLLEAMYMQKLCLVSDAVGNRDVIRNGQNGFLCKTEEDYVSALRSIIDNTADTGALIDTAYRDILREYNTDVMCGKYKNLYA